MSTEKSSSQKLPTPVLAALIALGAIVAGGAAFLATTTVLAGGDPSKAELCQQGKDEVLSIQAAAPDASMLDSNPALSLQLNSAGQKIYDNCIYREGREFELQTIDPWLGTPPAATPTDPATQPPTSSSAPSTSTDPATDPATDGATSTSPTEPSDNG